MPPAWRQSQSSHSGYAGALNEPLRRGSRRQPPPSCGKIPVRRVRCIGPPPPTIAPEGNPMMKKLLAALAALALATTLTACGDKAKEAADAAKASADQAAAAAKDAASKAADAAKAAATSAADATKDAAMK